MAEMTITDAARELRSIIDDSVVIDDGAENWDIDNLIESLEANETGDTSDYAISKSGITRISPDGYLESGPIYRVKPIPHEINVFGYESVEKSPRATSSGAANVYLPKSWVGKRILCVRLDP